MKIFLVGGGTLGPVTPLLAVGLALRRMQKNTKLFWIGTPHGPERLVVETHDIPFYSIPVAKLPRYPSLRWLTFPFAWMRARQSARRLIDQHCPDAVISMGGFTAVPVVYAAAKRNIPCFTHQLDLEPLRTNLAIARVCRLITTSFEYEHPPFASARADERVATPVLWLHKKMPSRHEAAQVFGLDARRPTILIFGGGTGAQAINEMVERTLAQWLSFAQLIHGTGKGKTGATKKGEKGYYQTEFFGGDMPAAYAMADLIVARAGIGTLSEIAAFKKPAILVPIPYSHHQKANARAFEEQGAAIVIDQEVRFDQEVLSAAKLLLKEEKERHAMGQRAHAFFPTDDGTALAQKILKELV